MHIDGDMPGEHYNPDEDGIDPVTIFRFQENTRRLDRLRAELTGQPIPGAIPKPEMN